MFVNPSTSPSLVSTIPGTNPTRNTAPIESLSIRMLSGFAFLPYDAGFVKTAKHGRQGFSFGVNGSGFPSNIIKWSRHRAVNNNSAPIRPVQSFPCPAEQCQFLNRQFFRHKVILVFVLLICPYFEQTVIVCEKRWRRLRPRTCPTEIVNSSRKSRGYVALIVMDTDGPACDAEIWPYCSVQDNHIPTYHIRMSVGKEKVYNWEIWDYHCAVWLEVNVVSWFSAFLLLLSMLSATFLLCALFNGLPWMQTLFQHSVGLPALLATGLRNILAGQATRTTEVLLFLPYFT